MVSLALLTKLLPRKLASQPIRAPDPDYPGSAEPKPRSRELGGPAGPEPTRYGDWERNGRSIDF